MSASALAVIDKRLPNLSRDVTLSPADRLGRRVAKNVRKRTYLRVGEEESFLLARFDGKTSYRAAVAAFEGQFGDAISCDDVAQFVETARKNGLVRRRRSSRSKTKTAKSGTDRVGVANTGVGTSSRGQKVGFWQRCASAARKQSPLYFRISLFDPNSSLERLEPRTRWLFSTKTAVLAAIFGCLALFIAGANWSQLTQQLASIVGWKTAVIAWVSIISATVCHEYGHGLACKRYGGEVREMGFLWIFFMPCFYCNVSDAWLIPSRSRRLLVSMAGTYVDFLIWIVAVFLWRFAAPNTWLSVATLIIVTTCGLRVAFNLNPLMRMDGYYALSDMTGVHNLRRRGRARLMEFTRWILWGAARPQRMVDGKVLLSYGIVSWLFVVSFMLAMTLRLSDFLQPFMGLGGVLGAASLFCFITKRYFKGTLGEDFKQMFQSKKLRLLFWIAVLTGVCLIPITDRAGGEFFVRPLVHGEVRAPVAGFLKEVNVKQGQAISQGEIMARLEVPELTSQIVRKKLEIEESQAMLRQLQCGTRPETMAEQTAKIERITNWRELAKQDLERARHSLRAELAAFEYRIQRAETDLKYRSTINEQAKQLHDKGGLAGQQLLVFERQLEESRAQMKEARSEREAREASGVLIYETELARREKELADTISDLTLMEAGTRPEEVDAEKARLRRLQEEMNHLQSIEQRQNIVATVSGTVTTARLREKIGHYLQLGEVICVVEDLSEMEAEIAVSEHDAYLLQPGQLVTLRPRSLPFNNIEGEVERIAPATLTVAEGTQLGTAKANLAVYRRVANPEGILRTGMTGFGRVHSEKKSLGWYVINKALRLLRTEFWW